MPSILKVRIVSAVSLPSSYAVVSVEVRLDQSINPQSTSFVSINQHRTFEWNTDFRFEISDDTVLQDMPLQCKVLGRETVVGAVFIDLNPLLVESGAEQLVGHFPIYNVTMGITGQLLLQAKLEVFGDINPWKYSSAGVDVFAGLEAPQLLPDGRGTVAIVGLVDVIIMLPKVSSSSDTFGSDAFTRRLRGSSLSWSESKRKPTMPSGYDREGLLFNTTGKLRRLLGLKAMELHANTVVGFKSYFDFTRDGVMVRGIGTAVKMSPSSVKALDSDDEDAPTLSPSDDENRSDMAGLAFNQVIPGVIPLLTITKMPACTLRSVGGIVSAKNVKLLSRSRAQQFTQGKDAELRQEWFDEMRQEIREHARLLRCNVVYGYSEQVTAYDDLYLVMAHGTAARCDFSQLVPSHVTDTKTDEQSNSEDASDDDSSIHSRAERRKLRRQRRREKRQSAYLKHQDCSACHLPYKRARSPFPGAFSWCRLCQRRHVPEVIFSTADLPHELDCLKERTLIEAYVTRSLGEGEHDNPIPASAAAISLSTVLPFVEYDLHRQLLYRLRLVGANAVWSLNYRLVLHSGHVVAIASGTAVCLSALPPPDALKCIRTLPLSEGEHISEVERSLEALSLENEQRVRQLLSQNPRVRLTKDDSASPSSSSETDSSSQSSSSTSSSSSGSTSSTNDPLSFVQIDDETDLDILQTLRHTPLQMLTVDDREVHLALSTTDELPLIQVDTIDSKETIISFPCFMIHDIDLVGFSSVLLAEAFERVRQHTINEHLKRHPPLGNHLLINNLDYQLYSTDDHLQVVFSATIYEKQAHPSRSTIITPTAHVFVTPGTRLPNSVLLDHKGHISLHINRDLIPHSSCLRILGDVTKLAKAEVIALGGNALVGVTIDYTHVIAVDAEHDRKSYELSISGDVQLVEMDSIVLTSKEQ